MTTRRELNALHTAATEAGAILPAEVEVALTRTNPLARTRMATRADAARTIADASGDKNEAKIVASALASVAAAEAATFVRSGVDAALEATASDVVHGHRAGVLASFSVALAPAFETLNTYAPLVPANTDPDRLASLAPTEFEAAFKARAAAAQIESVVASLGAVLYVPADVPRLTTPQRRRLALIHWPEDIEDSAGYAFADALRDTAPGTSRRGVFWFAVAASIGATFALITDVTEREDNAQRATFYLTPKIKPLPAR